MLFHTKAAQKRIGHFFSTHATSIIWFSGILACLHNDLIKSIDELLKTQARDEVFAFPAIGSGQADIESDCKAVMVILPVLVGKLNLPG